MKNTKRKSGISLIVLVITIIVMIILAGSIILSLSNSGIINQANKAKNDTDMSTLKEVAGVAAAEYELEVAKGTTTQTKKEYVESYLSKQGLTLPEGYEVTEEGQVAEAEKISVWDGTVATSFASGTGTEADPYIIKTAQQFAYFAEFYNASTSNSSGKYFKLVSNIDLNNISWTSKSSGARFAGNFNGDNCKIYNLNIVGTEEDTAFMFIDSAYISNLIIESGSISGNTATAAIFNDNGSARIVGVTNKANITAQYVAAGICYVTSSSMTNITECANYGIIATTNNMASPNGPHQISNHTYTNCQELGQIVLPD